MLYFIQY